MKKKKSRINFCLFRSVYIIGRYFWQLLIWSNRIYDIRFKADELPWTKVNIQELFYSLYYFKVSIIMWFLFSSDRFSVTSINRLRREIGLNWMSCADKNPGNSQSSWLAQEQRYRHHNAWKIQITGTCYNVGLDIPLIYDFLPIPPSETHCLQTIPG